MSSSSSSAIQIKSPAPPGPTSPTITSRRTTDASQQRQCRNVLIYGSCKYEGKGCSFYHPPKLDQALPSPVDTPTEPPRVASPISIQHLNAPEFVPAAALAHTTNGTSNVRTSVELSQQPDWTKEVQVPSSSQPIPAEQEHPPEFYPEALQPPLYPLQYHLYHKSSTPYPDLSGQHQAFFVSDDIREELQKRTEDIWAPRQTLTKAILPDEVHNYHSIMPLEPLSTDRRKYFLHWMSSCYRGTNAHTGSVYTLRRIENFRLMHESAFAAVEPWRQYNHPNIVRIKEAFTTRAFNDSSLVIVYDYHPLAVTLHDSYLNRSSSNPNVPAPNLTEPIDEATIWSFIIQIANPMKGVHDLGLAFRVLEPTKILVTEKGRLRINCCGLADLVSPDLYDMGAQQQEDMLAFGRLLIALCTRGMASAAIYSKAMDYIGRIYSDDLKSAIAFLMMPNPRKIVGQLFDIIGSRLLLEMDAIQLRGDSLEAQLACETENGRLVRLLSKFGFINERPEFALDPQWSEMGDRYLVKLFRDHVFHSVDEHGRPVVSLSHVLSNLNKLDAGSEEKLMLISRDDRSCLVVSYREIKRAIESAFRELVSV